MVNVSYAQRIIDSVPVQILLARDIFLSKTLGDNIFLDPPEYNLITRYICRHVKVGG